MHGQPFPQASRQQYFGNICKYIEQDACGENYNALLKRMGNGKSSGIYKPENDNAWIKAIDKKAGKKDLGMIFSVELNFQRTAICP
jgi:hypothetical protein